MINLRDNLTRKNIAITAVVVVLLMVLQFAMMKMVKSANSEVQELEFENLAANVALKNRTDSVMKLKSSLRFDSGMVPDQVASPTVFYGELAKMLNSSGLTGASTAKAAESGNLVSFKVSGTGQYFALLDALASLRQSGKLLRLTDLDVKGGRNGAVDYSFTVQAQSAVTDQTQDGGGPQ